MKLLLCVGFLALAGGASAFGLRGLQGKVFEVKAKSAHELINNIEAAVQKKKDELEERELRELLDNALKTIDEDRKLIKNHEKLSEEAYKIINGDFDRSKLDRAIEEGKAEFRKFMKDHEKLSKDAHKLYNKYKTRFSEHNEDIEEAFRNFKRIHKAAKSSKELKTAFKKLVKAYRHFKKTIKNSRKMKQAFKKGMKKARDMFERRHPEVEAGFKKAYELGKKFDKMFKKHSQHKHW